MTTTDRATVVGVFTDDTQAQQAIEALRQAGFRENQISYSGHGASSGGFLAGLKSFFTGEDYSTGGAYHDLVGMGMFEEDAQAFSREYEAGRSIVAVTGNRAQEASTFMSQYGGYGPGRSASRMTDYDTTTAAPGQTTADTDEARRLKLREEQLQVYKQPVQTGEVGLYKEVVSEQQSINVPVTHEEVYIERRAGSGQVSDAPIGEGESIRVPVSAEQVQFNKQTVETGEVAIGKRAVQETQQVSETVRHEEARVDRQGEANVRGDETDTDLPGR
ncbi:MAG TPA: YsnF/AvaK domain-containing protein [Ktedonobacteraceae bacterium]|nr:YsnF/AvaK domain-containing protein [Ktedonobacteraceae bacterium]